MTASDVTDFDIHQVASIHGVDLAFDHWGPSEPTSLLLGHGFTGGVHDFILQIPELAHARSVYSFDHRGHGRSTKLGRLDGYSIDQLVADEIAFIEDEIGAPVDLLGHSMGGRVALGVVLERPDLVRSLILMDTSAWSFQPLDAGVRDLIANFMISLDPARGVPNMAMTGPEDALIEAETSGAWRDRKAELSGGVDPYAIKALGTELLASNDLSVRDRLAEISCHTTVIVGSHDHPFIDQAPDLVASIANSHLSVIDGAYHSPQLTHPQPWREAIEQHLSWVAAT